MRIWDVAPQLLCRSHLLGEHREGHAVFAVISGGRRGYREHPETKRWVGKLPALARRHALVADEMRRRGYRHASPMRSRAGSRIQRARLLSIEEQIARLSEKPCTCPVSPARCVTREGRGA